MLLQMKMLSALAQHYEVHFSQSSGRAIVASLLSSVGANSLRQGMLDQGPLLFSWLPGHQLGNRTTSKAAGRDLNTGFPKRPPDHVPASSCQGSFSRSTLPPLRITPPRFISAAVCSALAGGALHGLGLRR